MGKVQINEHTVRKIKELYVDYDYNKEMVDADRNAMNKVVPSLTARTNAHFEIAISEADKERQLGFCNIKR